MLGYPLHWVVLDKPARLRFNICQGRPKSFNAMQAMGPNLNQDSMQCMLVASPIKQMLDQPTASKQV